MCYAMMYNARSYDIRYAKSYLIQNIYSNQRKSDYFGTFIRGYARYLSLSKSLVLFTSGLGWDEYQWDCCYSAIKIPPLP